jgi:O-acetyl-ADP-ribose deacetylase (regulator of RNase III)
MSGGIAGQFKKRYPAMFEEYRALAGGGRLHLGDVHTWIGEEKTIYNLALQENWRKKATLPALSTAIRKMISLAEKGGIERIGLPRLGSGLGGLDWARVKRVLEDAGKETKVSLVVYAQFVRTPVASG